MRLVNWRTLVVAAAGFGLAACGDDVTVTPTPISFTTNPASVACVAGTSTAVGLSVAGGTGTPTVTFQASGSGFTVTQNGNSATIACTAAGAGAVNFTITSGGQTVTGSIPVTVSAAPAPTSPVTAVIVNPMSLTLVPGGSGQLTATVTLATGAPAGTSTNVTWASSDATVATVDANGRVTALAGAAGRTAVITATSVANTNLKASAAVTVGPASSLVSALSVSPSAVSLSTGGTQQITSNVTLAAGAPAGTSTGVNYTSSDTSIAKVSSTGLITAGSNAGVATITVSSVAAPTVTQTIGVTVTAPQPVRLTIQSLRVVNAAGNTVPADPTNVFGNLFATLNLDPGSFKPDSVVATLGTQRILCQKFSVQLAQALKSALTDGSADVQPIECAINTAQFNTTTGAVSVQNGQAQLSATVYYRPSAGAPASESQTATINQTLTLNNQSGYFVSATNTPSAAQVANGAPANGQATGPQGVLWRAGSVTVTALPVFFTTPQGQTGTQTLNVNLFDNTSGQIATKQTTAAAGAAFTVTFGGTTAAYTPTPANQALNGYTSPGAGTANGGTIIQIGGAANTVFLSSNGVPQAAGPVIWIDNAYPEPRTQFVSSAFLLSGNPTQGFLNGTFDFAASVQQAAAATPLADNNGVDRVARSFFFATNTTPIPTAAQIVAGAQAATTSTGGINIPANPTLGQYVAAVNLVDALGNAVAQPVNAANSGFPFQFGVSTAAPTLTPGGTAANNGRYGITTTTARTVTATVTSPVGFARNPALYTVTLVNPAGTFCAAAGTADVTDNSGAGTSDIINSATAPANGQACAAIAAGSVSINPTTAAEGIYTVTVQARDVAGNTSAVSTRTFVIDRTAPVVTNAVPATVPLRGGAPATFTAQATDNLSLVSQLLLINYGTGLGVAANDINLRYDGAALGSAFATPFTQTANLSVGTSALIRGINLASAGGAVTNYGTNQFVPINGVAVGATDAGNNAGYAGINGAAIAALMDQTQTAPVFFGTATGLQNISITYTPNTTTTASATPPANLYGTAASGPQSVTIRVIQNGVANTPFQSAFQRIEIYQRAAAPGAATAGAVPFTNTNAYTLLGSASIGGLTVTPTTSQIASTFTFTPASFPTTGTTSADLLIVAVDANGFAVAAIVPTITLNP